ncbi:MAG: hypothetical protein Kow00128_08250 [Deltaproteobacteria bacterium]
MANRPGRWAILLVLLVALSFLGVRQLLRSVPDMLREAEVSLVNEGRSLGLEIRFRNLQFHPMSLSVSLDNLILVDRTAERILLRAERVDLPLSLHGLVFGGSPVSRIRIRRFAVRFDGKNLPLVDRLRSGGGGAAGSKRIPEILLLDGDVEAGPVGPIVRWTTHVRHFRIRDRRYPGREISGSFERSAARVAPAGAEPGRIPIDSGAFDLVEQGGAIRIRNLRLTGQALSIQGSGRVDPGSRSATFKAAGRGDLRAWRTAGGIGSGLLSGIATGGQVEFSVRGEGSPDRSSGSGKLALRGLLLPGGVPVDGELTASLSGDLLRIAVDRGGLWDGTFEGKGELDLSRREGRGALVLSRVRFGKAPWKSWGIGWRPAGSGSARLDLSGTRRRIHATAVVENPDGLERPGDPPARVPVPVSGRVEMALAPGEGITVERVRVLAGKAEFAGSGDYSLSGRMLRGSGTVDVPAGDATRYGWNYPLSWGGLRGTWTLRGPVGRLHLTGEVRGRDLAARSLPPLPVTLKFEGDPGESIHFAADCPSDVARVTATGTLSGLLAPGPFLLNASVIARSIDASRAGRFAGDVLRSLGRDPAPAQRLSGRIAGTASADLQLSIGGGNLSVSGTLVSDRIRAFGIEATTVSCAGGWKREEGIASWRIRGSGRMGEGNVLVTGSGRGPEGTLFGSGEGVDLDWAASLLKPDLAGVLDGKGDLDVAARTGVAGWNIERFSLSVPRLAIRHGSPAAGEGRAGAPVAVEHLAAEGSLGDRTGTVRITAGSPPAAIHVELARQPDWPASVSGSVDNVGTPFLAALSGGEGSLPQGQWDLRGEGGVRLRPLLAGEGSWIDAVTRLALSVTGRSVAVSGIAFEEVRVSGSREGDSFRGRLETRGPDSRLEGHLSFREPYSFAVRGPFSLLRKNGDEGGRASFSLNGSVEAAGAWRRPERTTGSLAIDRFTFRGGGVDLTGEEISLRMDPAGIRWAGGVLRAEGNPVEVSGSVSWNGELDLRLEGTLPAATARLATDVFDRLDGTVQTHLRVTGRWDNPTLVGTGHLEGGTLSFRGYGQLFEEMRADLVLSRERIVFEDFEGRSGGGYLDGSGEVPLRFDHGQRLYFSVDFFDMRYPYPEDLHPVVQGHVDLFGPPKDLLISGDVEVQSALYTKSVRLEKVLLDFRRRLANVTARRRESDFRIRLDIEGVADGTIRVRNNLGEAVAKGEFKVVGDTGRVILLGSFDGIEGTVNYRGNRYEITRLNVDFQDPLRLNPRIDARAETKKGNVNVIVGVTGTLEKIEVEFTSDPPLSKNDIVSLLSLGVTSENLVGTEGSLSAAEAASIALGPYTGRVEEEIRGIVGLDKFTIEPSFSSTDKSFEPRFTVGKSFGERFSVSVSTSVGASAESSATAELQVFEHVFLQGNWESGTADTEGDIGGDVRFRYRYRQFQDLFHGRD